MNRICIYPKDIQIITGKSERYARSVIQKIKAHNKKEKHQAVTIDEFCQYLGLKQERVIQIIR
jgi:hypothetical protein